MFVDAQAALDAVPRVAAIMGAQLGWSDERRVANIEAARRNLRHSFFCDGS